MTDIYSAAEGTVSAKRRRWHRPRNAAALYVNDMNGVVHANTVRVEYNKGAARKLIVTLCSLDMSTSYRIHKDWFPRTVNLVGF